MQSGLKLGADPDPQKVGVTRTSMKPCIPRNTQEPHRLLFDRMKYDEALPKRSPVQHLEERPSSQDQDKNYYHPLRVVINKSRLHPVLLLHLCKC